MLSSAQSPFPALPKVGLTEPYHALLWAPRKHEAFPLIRPEEIVANLEKRVVLEVTAVARAMTNPQKSRQFSIKVLDTSGAEHRLTLFGVLRISPWNDVQPGHRIFVRVKPVLFRDQVYLNAVELVDPSWVNRIVPFYAGKPGVASADSVRAAVDWAISNPGAVSDACLAIRQAYTGLEERDILARARGSGSLEMLLYALHRPRSMEMASWAMAAARRIAVDNLLYIADQSTQRPLRMQTKIAVGQEEIRDLIAQLPYAPTAGARSQMEAIHSIFDALAQPYAMDAILTADVGVGKTLCYMVPAVAIQRRGGRVCVIVPNSILAEGIANEFRQAYPDAPVAKVCDLKDARAIQWEENPILIGTVRLNGIAKKRGWVPTLLVIDEQQKMSVEQREALCSPDTNVIEASATPLPQTIALVRYGNKLRIEVDKQHAQKIIHTHITSADDRRAMFNHLSEVVRSGYQAAIIYPKVSNKGAQEKSVIAAGEQWEKMYPGQVITIHGQMAADDKAAAMAEARQGEKPIIVASSIIEIGVTISRLRFLIIVNADRYGVSTLHQMRGRLVRNGGEGWCYCYLPEAVEDETMERIQLLEQTTNGFELAELDMRLRGYGDLAGEMDDQSGKSRTLFKGLQLMPEDFDAVAPSLAA